MKQTYDDDRLFAVQGWAPVDDETKVRRVADDMGLALTVEQPADDELPPTLLKNPEFLAGGQQAVTFYLTPGYRWWDPSLVVLFSFALFFAMIISDAGYSALLGLVLAIFWRPLGKTVDGRRLRHMTLVLVGFALTWGVIVGSYFGLAPPKDSFLGRLVFIDTTNLNQMMMLSILIGASHLMLANAITAWRSVGTLKGLVPIGWIVSIIGGLLYGMASYDQIARVWETVGQWMLIIGLPTALLLNSDQPFPPRSIWHVLGRLGDGVKNLMAVSAAFGDTLSYLRLFALGLSGAQLASTFNKLAADSVESFGGIGLVLGVVIIVVGHSLNFVLGIMGGVIHGLRLNCIEFFNWCSTDEGYPFGAFSKKADH
jgi:V/A-type H+-transporting ATPase subunit I